MISVGIMRWRSRSLTVVNRRVCALRGSMAAGSLISASVNWAILGTTGFSTDAVRAFKSDSSASHWIGCRHIS